MKDSLSGGEMPATGGIFIDTGTGLPGTDNEGWSQKNAAPAGIMFILTLITLRRSRAWRMIS